MKRIPSWFVCGSLSKVAAQKQECLVLFVMSPFAFTPTDLSALQKGAHAVINQPMLIISGHLHGLDKRKKRNRNARYFPPFAFKGRVKQDKVGCGGCYREFRGCAAFGGGELIPCSWQRGHLLNRNSQSLLRLLSCRGRGCHICTGRIKGFVR